MKFSTLIILPFILLLSSCETLKNPDTQAKIKQTAFWLASKVASAAVQGVVSAATSQQDAGTKANWLDSFAQGARASVSLSDIKEVQAIWTPAQPHWAELASSIVTLAAKTDLTNAQKVEAIAVGLNEAAATARAK